MTTEQTPPTPDPAQALADGDLSVLNLQQITFIEAFDAQHKGGVGSFPVPTASRLLFPDGASRALGWAGDFDVPDTPHKVELAKQAYELMAQSLGGPRGLTRGHTFLARHGHNVTIDNAVRVFSTGATCEIAPGWTKEPPDDVYQRRRLQLDYFNVRLKWAIREFDDLQGWLLERAAQAEREGTPSPPAARLDDLRALKDRADRYRALIRELEVDREQHIPEHVTRLAEMKRQAQEEGMEFMQELKQIQV